MIIRPAIPGDIAIGLAAAAMSSVLLALATPGVAPVPQPMLAWIAFAPWFAMLPRIRLTSALVSALALGLGYTIPGHWEAFGVAIAAAPGAAAHRDLFLVLLFASFAVPFMLFAWLDAALMRKARMPTWLRPLLQSAILASLIAGMWAPFPYTPTLLIVPQTVMLQIAGIGGEVLPLWLLLWSSAWLGGLVAAPRQWPTHRAGGLLLATIACACLGYGAWKIDTLDAQEAAGDGVTLQALPLQLDLPDHASIRTMLSDRAGHTGSALELSRDGLREQPRCEIAVWPEVPIPLDRVGALCVRGPQIASGLEAAVLMQCSRVVADRFQVTAALFEPGDAEPRIHAKSSLVPLYERPLLSSGYVEPGAGGSIFDFGAGRRLVPTLCYELHSRDHLRDASLQGGNIIIHMASFTPFERHVVDEIDLAMARIRAIEFRMPIVRSANRGAAGWIDAAGRTRTLSGRSGTSNQCVTVVAPADGPSPFAHVAPGAPWVPGGLALLLAVRLRARAGRSAPTADA